MSSRSERDLYPEIKIEESRNENSVYEIARPQHGFDHSALRRSSFQEESGRGRMNLMREHQPLHLQLRDTNARESEVRREENSGRMLNEEREDSKESSEEYESEDDSSYIPEDEASEHSLSLELEEEDLEMFVDENRPVTRSMSIETEKIKKDINHIRLAIIFVCIILVFVAVYALWDGDDSPRDKNCWEKFKLEKCSFNNPTPQCEMLLKCSKQSDQSNDQNDQNDQEEDIDDETWLIIGFCCIAVIFIIFLPERAEILVQIMINRILRK